MKLNMVKLMTEDSLSVSSYNLDLLENLIIPLIDQIVRAYFTQLVCNCYEDHLV